MRWRERPSEAVSGGAAQLKVPKNSFGRSQKQSAAKAPGEMAGAAQPYKGLRVPKRNFGRS